MKKHYAPHITAIISAVGGFITLMHPGFHVPPFVQGWVTTVCALVSGGIELVHLIKKHNLQAALAVAQQMAAHPSATPTPPAA